MTSIPGNSPLGNMIPQSTSRRLPWCSKTMALRPISPRPPRAAILSMLNFETQAWAWPAVLAGRAGRPSPHSLLSTLLLRLHSRISHIARGSRPGRLGSMRQRLLLALVEQHLLALHDQLQLLAALLGVPSH